jgi:hypothetical protein
MEIPGRVKNGVVVLEDSQHLPEGATVTVVYPGSPDVSPSLTRRRIQVPLVRTGSPGSVDLSNAQIDEIVNEEDVAS